MMSYKGYQISMIIFIVILMLLAFGCKTVKYIDRETVRVDSSMFQQNETLQKTLKETVEKYEKQIEQISNTGVVFDDKCDTVYKTVTKIQFDNGKLKSIEGNVRSLNSSLVDKSLELLDAHSTIDSMSIELERSEAKLSKKQEVLIKTVERKVLPGWIYFTPLLIVIGMMIEYRFKAVQRIKNIFLYKK